MGGKKVTSREAVLTKSLEGGWCWQLQIKLSREQLQREKKDSSQSRAERCGKLLREAENSGREPVTGKITVLGFLPSGSGPTMARAQL